MSSLLLWLAIGMVGAVVPMKLGEPSSKALSHSFGRASLSQGQSTYGTVSIDSLEGVKSLVVSVYYDDDAFNISSHNSLTTATLVDGNVGEGYVRYSYVFGDTTDISLNLFRYYFAAKSDATIGTYRFDVLVEEAYDAELNSVDINDTSGSITITESTPTKYATLYASGSSDVDYGSECSISYSFSTASIASGYLEWTYDDDALNFLSFEAGNFLTGKAYDVVSTKGSVRLTFVSTAYGYVWNRVLGSLRFGPKTNEDSVTAITCLAHELFDLELDPLVAANANKSLTIHRDESAVAYSADMSLVAMPANSYDAMVHARASLTANSHLGAGDFKITFDPELLELSSYETLLDADYVLVNDKKANEGILSVNVISLADIVDASDVIDVEFNVLSVPGTYHIDLGLEGKNLSDSLTNPIALRFHSDGIDFIPYLAEDYAQDFLTVTSPICASGEENQSALSAIWGEMKDAYLRLLDTEKNRFDAVEPDYSGISENILERALGRYGFIVGKYHFENYMGASILPVYLQNAGSMAPVLPWWAFVSISFVMAVGLFFAIRKKSVEE